MAYSNGRLPQSALAPITRAANGEQAYLRKDAAKAFNAMNAESEHKYGVTLRASSARTAYRTYAEQEYFWNLYKRGGNLAAYPGTSNHGLGLAIDLATPQMRQIVNEIGEKYGFAKKWSDAPGESWHIRWREGNYPAVTNSDANFKTLKRGQTGSSIIKLKKQMYAHGLRNFGSRYNPFFNEKTEQAIKRFQKRHNLVADGQVGAKTWNLLQGK